MNCEALIHMKRMDPLLVTSSVFYKRQLGGLSTSSLFFIFFSYKLCELAEEIILTSVALIQISLFFPLVLSVLT